MVQSIVEGKVNILIHCAPLGKEEGERREGLGSCGDRGTIGDHMESRVP